MRIIKYFYLLTLLLIPSIVFSAISCTDTATTGSVDNNVDTVWSHTVGSGSNLALIVTIAVKGDATVDDIDFGGVSLTPVVQFGSSSILRCEIWRLLNPTPSTANITATISTASGTRTATGAMSCSGVDQTTPFPNTVTGDGIAGGGHPSMTVTTAAERLNFDCVAVDADSNTISVDADQTERFNRATSNFVGAGSTQSGDDGGVMSWTTTDTGRSWLGVAASMSPASAGRRRVLNVYP